MLTGSSKSRKRATTSGRIDPTDSIDSNGVDLECSPELDQVSSIREFVENYYRTILRDPDLIGRIAVAAHELLENAAKYSQRAGSRLKIEIKGGSAPQKVSVSVSNFADPAQIDELKGTISELAKTNDVEELYQDYIQRAARRDQGSGLGLARIRAEAEMSLVLELDGNEVCVKAETPLQPEDNT